MQQKFAMNRALEQKLIGPMEESHTKQQSPKAVLWMVLWARRSKIAARWARTHAWAGWGFFWEEDGVCGCRNKWRGPPWAHEIVGAPRGCGRALHPRGQVLAPLQYFQCLKYSRKNHIKLAWHLENFYFWDIFYCIDNSENRQNILFLLYLF